MGDKKSKTPKMALIYLGYRALKKKMGDGNEEEELTEEEKAQKLAEPVKESKVKSIGGAAGGAAIGTMILPGVGTAIGAGVGAMMGKKASVSDKAKKEEKNKQELDRIEHLKRLQAQSEQSFDKIKVIVIRYDGALGLHLKQKELGVYITKVDDKSPAFEAGLMANDILISIEGKSVEQVVQVLRETKSEIHFTVKRLKTVQNNLPAESGPVENNPPVDNDLIDINPPEYN